MPVGRGGFHTIGLFMDVYSQKIFGYKFTGYGTATTTIESLNHIWQMYQMREVFMADGGSHFSAHAMGEWCQEHGPMGSSLFDDLPGNWPLHFDAAIEQLNCCILPALKFSPDELHLGTIVNTTETPLEISSLELTKGAVGIQNQYAKQQNLDAYSHMVEHANKRKAAFDKRVNASRDSVIEYKKGDLVQVCNSKLDLTISTESKLLPRWGVPHHVVNCIRNLYRLEMIQGFPVAGTVSARRLQRFVPRPGTELALEQLGKESERETVPDEEMKGLDFEEDKVDCDEGNVEDVALADEMGVD